MVDFWIIKVIVKTTKCQTDNAVCKDDTYRFSRRERRHKNECEFLVKNSRERRIKKFNMNMKIYEYSNSETHSNIP